MERLALFLLLAAGRTASAALPRVALDAPLTPVSAPAVTASPAVVPLWAAPELLGAAPAAAPALSAVPAAASIAPAPALNAAPALGPVALPDPAAFGAPHAAAAADGPRAIDALRANAPLAGGLAASDSPENAARALENNFNAAASLGSGDAAPAATLLQRLLSHVRLDEGGTPERRAALTHAFSRMLEAPTGRTYAERFVAGGIPAEVRFESFPGSRIYEIDGRKLFQAPRAYTQWKDGRLEVRVNLDYLGTDPEFLEQDLPPTLAHELFGHGLWYARAAKENALQAFHHHDLNETNARLVGWLVDHELDGRVEEGGAWSYVTNPEAFLNYLKLRLPYYALTWSTAELARPRETLAERSAAARDKRAQIARSLYHHETWNAVIDHFVAHHGLAESRLRALRGYMGETSQSYKDELKTLDALIAEVDATIARMDAEPDRASENYLKRAAAHPIFPALQEEADRNRRSLTRLFSWQPHTPESPAAAAAREDHWRGQLTFEELKKMYLEDRAKNPRHWAD